MTDRPLKRWLEDAGITKRITFHCFRHTYAVLQLASGTNIYTLSKMMLHKSIRSTEIYLDLLEETKPKPSDVSVSISTRRCSTNNPYLIY